METCYIFGAGDFTPCTIDLTSKDLVIAADGGYDYLIRLGLRADVVLGDFDSVTSPDLWDDAICEKLTYPPEKDDTDMMLAIKLGLSRGYREFALWRPWRRLDHTCQYPVPYLSRRRRCCRYFIRRFLCTYRHQRQ